MISRGDTKHAGLRDAEICQIWNIPPIRQTWLPQMGTIHHILLMSTISGKYALRRYCYGPQERWRIQSEHAVASYVCEQGLPAIAPLPLHATTQAETILEHNGHFYALFPFAEGTQIVREQMTSVGTIASMGRCLGELHHVLATYSPERVRRQSLSVDASETLVQIDRLVSVIEAKTQVDEFDLHMATLLRQRANWLRHRVEVVDVKELTVLPQQPLHGDFQETNLFFADDRVSAIIDWDKASLAPRAWEVLRTLHYVFHMDPPRCLIFLEAYRQIFPLSSEELAITARVYGWVQANNLWACNAYYLEQNHRVRNLLSDGSAFVPFETLWAVIAASLH